MDVMEFNGVFNEILMEFNGFHGIYWHLMIHYNSDGKIMRYTWIEWNLTGFYGPYEKLTHIPSGYSNHGSHGPFIDDKHDLPKEKSYRGPLDMGMGQTLVPQFSSPKMNRTIFTLPTLPILVVFMMTHGHMNF